MGTKLEGTKILVCKSWGAKSPGANLRGTWHPGILQMMWQKLLSPLYNLQKKLAHKLHRWRREHPRRNLVFVRHLHFMDFSKFGAPVPYYFNQVRDPANRFRSRFYWRRRRGGYSYVLH